ncbi:MAG: tetratricopeptide repeat protein [Myxococcota bacterium]
MTDRHARDLAARPVPWDDIRQRRVLGRIEATLAETRSSTAAPTKSRRRGPILGAGLGLAVAAAAAIALVVLPSAPVEEAIEFPAVTESLAVAPVPSIPFASWPELRLPDDSVAQLRHGARVDVQVHTDELVELAQHSGEVRYEVTPNRTRAFVVDAAGVEVRVVGTIFTVTLSEGEPARVTVQVERGLVEVDNGTRVAELGPGDSLGLDVDDVDDEIIMVEPEPATEPATATKPASPRPAARVPSIETLLDDADSARAGGDLARGAAALRELVRHYPKDPRAYSALFQLGKVERARGRHAAAAAAFARCWKRSPRGPLAEDARAESAVSWQAAGRADRARTAAEGYLSKYPSGTHRARMQPLLGAH